MCDGRSIWTIDCRKFDDPDNDRTLRKHIGRNPKITKSILESENYHALHSRLYDGMHSFFSSKNIVIMTSDRPLEVLSTRACGRFCATSQGPACWRKSPSTNFEKSERQVPLLYFLRRTRVAESSTNWQSDSGTFTTAPTHWPVVFRIAMSLATQTKV